CGHPGPARRPGTGSARRQHHGVRQGVQRRHGGHARQRRPRRDHRLRGPFLHLHHEDPAGRAADQEGRRCEEGLRRAAQDQGRQDLQGPDPRDRRDQDARPELPRPRCRDEDHRRHRTSDGYRDRALSSPAQTVGGPALVRTTTPPHQGAPMKRSKTYRNAAAKINENLTYPPLEAVRLGKQAARTTYDETVEVVFRLGIDPRKADQMVRGTVNLPHGTGKTSRVLVFAAGDKADAAVAAGADFVGSDDLLEKVQGGWLDFDAVVATPDLMGKVGRLGKVLGPRGLMPNPKTGTVTMDTAKAV